MTVTTAFLSRRERFDRIGSTNDVVRDWLAAGTPEVCLAVADEQTAGRGRAGRTWVAPPGAALLVSLGFRPSWIAPEQVWRLPATVSLAMADAAEAAAGLAAGTIRLKWPNDLVIDVGAGRSIAWRNVDTGGVVRGSHIRKLGGVLGESAGLGTDDPQVIVGIGINASWRREDFPAELADAMTSLHEAAADRPIVLADLLDGFLARLEAGVDRLRADRFDDADWSARQVTTGELVELQRPDGGVELVRAVGVDVESGALLVDDEPGVRQVYVGEIRHLRFPMAGAEL